MTREFQVVDAISFEDKSSVLSALKNEKLSGVEVEDPNQHLTNLFGISGTTSPPKS